MLNFEYQIHLNEENRPYVYIPETYRDKPEDKFMVLELTRYLLNSIVHLRKESMSDVDMVAIESTLKTLELVSDELAILLKQQMEISGESVITTARNYHITVNTRKDRDDLKYENIIHNSKIFKRMIGLKVLVLEDMNIYELINGIDNNNWQKVG